MRHYHIRWADLKLDWEAFRTESAAEEMAKEIVRPDETYTIEQFNGNCPRCSETSRLGAKSK